MDVRCLNCAHLALEHDFGTDRCTTTGCDCRRFIRRGDTLVDDGDEDTIPAHPPNPTEEKE